MSAHSVDPDVWVDERADPNRDPYGIVPDDFVQAWGGVSIQDALAIAEDAPSSTENGELRRCPHCESVKVHSLPSDRTAESLKCQECKRKFDTSMPSRERSMPGEQATFREVLR